MTEKALAMGVKLVYLSNSIKILDIEQNLVKI